MTDFKPALLALADGSVFKGVSIGSDGQTVGEVVFNTEMTGYQEILTDSSYREQIVTLTYPHIGTVVSTAEAAESDRVNRSEDLSVGKECVHRRESRWVQYTLK